MYEHTDDIIHLSTLGRDVSCLSDWDAWCQSHQWDSDPAVVFHHKRMSAFASFMKGFASLWSVNPRVDYGKWVNYGLLHGSAEQSIARDLGMVGRDFASAIHNDGLISLLCQVHRISHQTRRAQRSVVKPLASRLHGRDLFRLRPSSASTKT
jgi:hypothetical protein